MEIHLAGKVKGSVLVTPTPSPKNLAASTALRTSADKFDQLKREITDLEAQEQRAVFIEEAERRSAAPVDNSQRAMESRVTVLDAIACQVESRAEASMAYEGDGFLFV